MVDVTATEANDASWTLLNVDTKTTFELRHWLVRNSGLGTEQKEFEANFEAQYGQLMHSNFLKACVSIINQRNEDAQRAKDEEQKRKEESGEVETVAQRLARQKAERKAAAVERSRLRQQSEGYFTDAKQANQKGKEKILAARVVLAALGGLRPHKHGPFSLCINRRSPHTSTRRGGCTEAGHGRSCRWCGRCRRWRSRSA